MANQKAAVVFAYEDLESYTQGFSFEIASGATSKVYRGQIPKDNPYDVEEQAVAVKVSLDTNRHAKAQLEKEITWMPQLQHANIIRLIGHCKMPAQSYLVLELATGGPLSHRIQGLTWKQTLQILRGIARAIQHMHSYAVVNGDLKPSNVLLLDEDLQPKLCDFGTIAREGDLLQESTPGYVDLLAIRTGLRSQGDDIYAFVVIVLQLIMKKERVLEEAESSNPEGTNINDWAKQAFNNSNDIVHHNLIQTGCSKKDARAITELGLQLTETQKRGVPKAMLDVVKELFPNMQAGEKEIKIVRPPIAQVLDALDSLKP